jgi:TDG/mug DNA glycosylase family protein
VVEDWMGEDVETLADLLRPGLRAVCVGINPSPVSVRVGHYYQGPIGQTFFARLRGAGVLRASFDGYEDDAAFAAGIGFTDIVKRPAPREKDVRAAEFEHGRELLRAKLLKQQPELVIFTFKKTARVLFGDFAGNGFVPRLKVAESEVFVMPGPMELTATRDATLRELAKRFATP